MKHVMLYVPALLLAGMFTFCKNNTPEKPTTEFIPERTDSLFGLKGCDRAGFRMVSPTEQEFTYQDFVVHVTKKPEGGEEIKAVRTDTAASDLVIVHEGPSYFKGAARGQIFVDEDKGSGNHEMAIYHVKRRSLMFRTPYCGNMELWANGNVWFYLPIEESEISKMPECPEKAEWDKKGWKTTYGQRSIYQLADRTLTKKSEFACIPPKEAAAAENK